MQVAAPYLPVHCWNIPFINLYLAAYLHLAAPGLCRAAERPGRRIRHAPSAQQLRRCSQSATHHPSPCCWTQSQAWRLVCSARFAGTDSVAPMACSAGQCCDNNIKPSFRVDLSRCWVQPPQIRRHRQCCSHGKVFSQNTFDQLAALVDMLDTALQDAPAQLPYGAQDEHQNFPDSHGPTRQQPLH